jgi:hypothetical protein
MKHIPAKRSVNQQMKQMVALDCVDVRIAPSVPPRKRRIVEHVWFLDFDVGKFSAQ